MNIVFVSSLWEKQLGGYFKNKVMTGAIKVNFDWTENLKLTAVLKSVSRGTKSDAAGQSCSVNKPVSATKWLETPVYHFWSGDSLFVLTLSLWWHVHPMFELHVPAEVSLQVELTGAVRALEGLITSVEVHVAQQVVHSVERLPTNLNEQSEK